MTIIPSQYTVTPADRARHLLPISQIVADQYAGGEHVEEISQQYIGNCHYDFDATRLVWDGDALVHQWGVWGYPMRIGSARLKTAGIGAVVTREPHRKQGLMETAATASFDAMRELGYDVSVLRGRHYVKYGYIRAWNYVTYRLTRDETARRAPTGVYQPLDSSHLEAVWSLYNVTHDPLSGTAVRPTYRVFEPNELFLHGWFDGNQLKGYVRAIPSEDKKSLQCMEATGDVEHGLGVLADLVKQGEYESLTFFTMHHDHPMLAHLRKGAVIVENRYFDITGWRVRLVNLKSILEKIRPLLEARLQESRFENWSGELHLDAGAQTASLRIERGTVQVAEAASAKHGLRAGHALTRLLIGSDDPAEVIAQEGIECEGLGMELARVLFPNLNPMLSHWDEY
ncbi:MAG: GNAT family N-acetyltransferase [Chloroflexi bacterium]|nr:GNAT family N-acetyltransferase [Chloroflexota bacterium]